MEAKLRRAAEMAARSKWVRMGAMPYKIALPLVLQRLGQTRFVSCRTFFNKPMRVVLPEPVSTTIWRYGAFEPEVAMFLLSELREGDTFIDVGGHFGFFSLLGAELVGAVGKTLTLEPMPATRELLSANLADFVQSGRSQIIPVAAGETTGESVFKDFGLVGSAFATSEAPRNDRLQACTDQRVIVNTLDNIVEAHEVGQCALIKIDAENSEEQVITGATKTIGTLRPALIVEMGDSRGEATSRSLALIEMLERRGYTPFELRNWEIQPHEKQDFYTHLNLLFRPA